MKRKLIARRLARRFLFATCLCASSFIVGEAQDASDLNQHLARARALAAVSKLDAAIAELDGIRRGAGDDVARDVATIMLMGMQFERGDYGQAQLLLDEAFNLRSSRGEKSKQLYFALAGQLMNGARARLERFRQFGLNVRADDLPDEVRKDLDQLRRLLEHVIEQAQRIRAEGGSDSESAALIEDAAGARMTLARDAAERAAWQARVAEARQWLVITEPRLASLRPVTPPGFDLSGRAMGGSARFSAADASREASVRATGLDESHSTPSASTSASAQAESAAPASETMRDERSMDGSPDEPKEIGADLIARAIQRVPPIYPTPAKIARVTGTVIVHLIVGEDGNVEKVVRSTGPALLRQAAEEAARRWRFRIDTVNGKRVRLSGFISFTFSL